ncbi:hypothetical protein GCM10010123_15840 [Pilimelia anulata]|uniref:SipW-cognate class signal peptide n=2 Tax=Pilimelia anulata TaxID=53371 RepID=A0A8J3B1W2_9ACTN|nr:hypothetical protein GCM10010123_15840 [Pilimelia anulata]
MIRNALTARTKTVGWLTVSGLTAGGALLTSAGVFASWSSAVDVHGGTNDTAAVGLTHVDTNGTTFSTGAANMLPGDYLYRYATLTNTGELSETFSAAVSGSGDLGAAGGLQLAIDACSVAWAGNGSCSGSTTALAAATDAHSAGSISLGTLAAGAVKHLRYRVQLSAAADQLTFQGKDGAVDVTISGTTVASGNRDRTGG